MKAVVNYDKDARAAYMELIPKMHRSTRQDYYGIEGHTLNINGTSFTQLIIDYDANDKILGIELI